MNDREVTYMGRRPDRAAPTASPAKPISVMGVSTTRFSPNLSSRPFVTCAIRQTLFLDVQR